MWLAMTRNWDKFQAECQSVKDIWGNGALRTHPEIHKHLNRMLQDRDSWEALHKRAGSQVLVLCTV